MKLSEPDNPGTRLLASLSALEASKKFSTDTPLDLGAYQRHLDLIGRVLTRQAKYLATRFPDKVPEELLSKTAALVAEEINLHDDSPVTTEELSEVVGSILLTETVEAQKYVVHRGSLN